MSSMEANKAIVRRGVEAGWNAGDLLTLDMILAAGCVHHRAAGGTFDNEVYKQGIVGYRTAFPDLRFAIEDEIAEGDKVVIHMRARGTHTGELVHPLVGRIAPTRQRVEFTSTATLRLADGKIVEHWANTDWLGMLMQLGATLNPSAGAS